MVILVITLMIKFFKQSDQPENYAEHRATAVINILSTIII